MIFVVVSGGAVVDIQNEYGHNITHTIIDKDNLKVGECPLCTNGAIIENTSTCEVCNIDWSADEIDVKRLSEAITEDQEVNRNK